MAGRKIHVSSTNLFFGLLIAAFLLLWLPHTLTSRLNLLFASVFNPVLQIGRSGEQLRQSGTDSVSRGEYDKLWKAYENLHAQLKKLHEEYETVSLLRQRLPLPGTGFLLCEVTSINRGVRHEMILNRGAEHGVRVNQLVLSENRDSVLGTVIETADQVCRVRLLTDPAQNLEILIRRPGTDQMIPGRLVGDGRAGCKIPLLPRDYDIRTKDVVYAAAKPGRLEVPVVVGEISQVKRDDQSPLLWDISVELIDNPFEQHRAVVLIPPEL